MIDKETFLKPRLPERQLEIAGVGTITVRGLSRAEVVAVREECGGDLAVMERRVLALGMVDPPLTDDEVAAWWEVSPAGEIEPIIEAISEMSALGKGAAKSGLPGL